MDYRKTIQHYHEPGQLHELTFSCYQRRSLLTNDNWRRRLARHIDAAGEAEQIDLVAFVYMPEHIHLLTYPRVPEPDLGKYLARLKQPFSKEIKGLLDAVQSPLVKQLTVQERPGKTSFRFWQEGPGYDRNVWSSKVVLSSIAYIHENPIRRRLCRRPVDWLWSSARYYYLNPQKQQFPDLPFVHGLPLGILD